MQASSDISSERFDREYAAKPAWEIGRPQPALATALAQATLASPVLDIGCGSGDLAAYVAADISRPNGAGGEASCEVLGVDFAAEAIRLARQRFAAQPGLSFIQQDIFELPSLKRQFGTILDSCFMHMLDGEGRQRYSALLHELLLPGGQLHLLGLAIDLPTPNAPNAVSPEDIALLFGDGWKIVHNRPATVAVTFMPEPLPGTYACIEAC